MGLCYSRLDYDVPLVSQTEPICIIDPKYCLKQSIQLLLKERASFCVDGDFVITDTSNGQKKFEVTSEPLICDVDEDKSTLRDPTGKPIVNIRSLYCLDSFSVYDGEDSDSLICRIWITSSQWKFEILMKAPDQYTRKIHNIVMKSDPKMEGAVVYLSGVPIAKMSRTTVGTSYGYVYTLEIGAGVDISLMIILCIAFDTYSKAESTFLRSFWIS